MEEKVTVLQVCAYTAVYGGNFIASIEALAIDMEKNGVITEFLFPVTVKDRPWCLEMNKRWKIYFADLNRFSLKTYFQIKAAMKNATIVHSHFELYDVLVYFAARRQSIYWHLHDSFDENIDLPHRIINKFQYKVFSKGVVLISPNSYYSDYVVKIGFNGKNVRVVDNCIDLSRLSYKNSEKKYDFLIFGGFYYTKGLDVLLNACRMLKKECSFKLGIVGYKDTWKWIDDNYGDLSDVICRVEPNENVSELYNSAGVFICSSRRENFPYSLLEALFLKKPAIVSKIAGTKWAQFYETVKVFDIADCAQLKEEMKNSLMNKTTFTEESLNAVSKDVAQKYSIDNWVKNIERIYFHE